MSAYSLEVPVQTARCSIHGHWLPCKACSNCSCRTSKGCLLSCLPACCCCSLLLLLLLLLLQMMDESGPEHLAKAMGPQQTARLLMDTLDLGVWRWQHILDVHYKSAVGRLQRVSYHATAALQ
jgi:hypothetical protein